MTAPLAGLKVIELARVLAGPWIGQTLADLGAIVTKIESPAGDETRGWGPPFATIDDEEISAYFLSCNRGKSSVVIDFNDEKQLARLKQMISESDIVIENFKVGGLQKYGLDYESVSRDNPKIIYASITGFGQDGPYAERAGYDYLIQGMGGIMDLTGTPDGPPQKLGVAFTDIFTGLYGVIGIQAALRHRDQTGEGQQIDLSLYDSLIGVLANQGMNYLVSGKSPTRMGNAHPNICPYAVFEAKDGYVILAIGNDGQFDRFCEAFCLSEARYEARFATNKDRVANRQELSDMIAHVFARYEVSTILQICERHVIPAGPVHNVEQALRDPQTAHRQMVITLDGIEQIRTPLRFSKSTLALSKSAPKLGDKR
ncbi:MAG: CaiB/BaiF CoA transferase family protein [Candidatus Puniceispirillaceae bacterium]